MPMNMHYKHLCLSCYKEQKEVYSVEAVNVPPIKRECDGCGKRRQVWKYKVVKKHV